MQFFMTIQLNANNYRYCQYEGNLTTRGKCQFVQKSAHVVRNLVNLTWREGSINGGNEVYTARCQKLRLL